ncbi:MAG: YdcF family protein [Candidatus Hodarchaeota archaeon]
MSNPLSCGKIVIFMFIIFATVLFLSHQYLLQQIGRFLIIEQNPVKADIIVVLNGRDTERSLAAVDLYNKGYADLILIARGPKQPGSDEFWKRVGSDWNSKIFFQRAIEAMGIPDSSFKMIGNGATSTYDEAKVAKRFVNQNGYKSILIVTSKWHSKRAYLTFRSVFNKDTEIKKRITIHPSKYDTFDPDNWWKTGADAELVFREYVRLIYYIVMLRISLFHII